MPIAKFSISQLERHVRKTAADSLSVLFTDHVRGRMRQRAITREMVLEVLRKGVLRRAPEPNAQRGTLECRMERYIAGREIGAVVAVSDDDPHLIVVTAMILER